jgi:hypothetical protein
LGIWPGDRALGDIALQEQAGLRQARGQAGVALFEAL